MAKKLFVLAILLALAIGVANPASQAAASETAKIQFTTTSTDLCPGDPRCSMGDWVPMPGGGFLVHNFVAVLRYDSTDPRWNVTCVCAADLIPVSPNVFPYQGKFVCTANDPAYAGGWWEGITHRISVTSKGVTISHWDAHGYGAFDRLLAKELTSSGNVGMIEITELPGY